MRERKMLRVRDDIVSFRVGGIEMRVRVSETRAVEYSDGTLELVPLHVLRKRGIPISGDVPPSGDIERTVAMSRRAGAAPSLKSDYSYALR